VNNRIGKDVKGNCHGLIKVQPLHLLGRRRKSPKNLKDINRYAG
jgi:hypothetical protein